MLKNVLINDFEYEIENVRYQKNLVYAKFLSVNNINDAEKLKGSIIKIPEHLALPLQDDEYYLQDLYGLNVYEGDEFLGQITDIILGSANDIYVVDEKIFIPAVKSFILNIDIKNKLMSVKLIEGLRELNA